MDAWASQSLATLYADLTEKILFLSGQSCADAEAPWPSKEREAGQAGMHKYNSD